MYMNKKILIFILAILTIIIFIQPGFGVKKAEKSIKGKKVIFVTKLKSGIVPSDQVLIDHLTGLGLEVATIDQKEASQETAKKFNLVFLSENVDSKVIGNKFLKSKIPVFSSEHYITDDMGFAGTQVNVDYGETDIIYKEIKIKNSKHPIASGFDGLVTVYKENGKFSWSKPQGEIDIIATLPNDDTVGLIYTCDKRKKNKDGIMAQARIAFFYLYRGFEPSQTEDSWKLFDAAIKWCLGAL